MVTEQDVISVLRTATKAMKARELAVSLKRTLNTELTRTDVNQILYKLRGRGVAEVDSEFRWRLSAGGREESTPADGSRTRAETYYEILQVTKNAHPSVIAKAYKALVAIYHPDRSTPIEKAAAEEQMKLINVAYETLSDPRKRAQYDKALQKDY